MRFAYADPPYLGTSARDYGELHPDAADYDDPATHLALIARLVDGYPDGWAVSLHLPSLRLYLAHVPDDARVGAYCRTMHHIRNNVSVQYAWEPMLWRGGRKLPKRNPMVRDWVAASNTGQGLKGSKPPKFNRWVLDVLGYDPGQDTLDDLFPGTGGMGKVAAATPFDFGGVA